MFTKLLAILSLSAFLISNVQANEEIFSCKLEYVSDYGEYNRELISLEQNLQDKTFHVILEDKSLVNKLLQNLDPTPYENVTTVEITFNNCNFSKGNKWDMNCHNPVNATFLNNEGQEVRTFAPEIFTSGFFKTEEENKNWVFFTVGLTSNDHKSSTQTQFHVLESCTIK